MLEQITPRDLKARQDAAETFTLIDVREEWEADYASIPRAELRPLIDIYTWARELDPEGDYVIHCHVGVRSANACLVLTQMGFKRVKNLAGGIDAWSVHVDPSVPRY